MSSAFGPVNPIAGLTKLSVTREVTANLMADSIDVMMGQQMSQIIANINSSSIVHPSVFGDIERRQPSVRHPAWIEYDDKLERYTDSVKGRHDAFVKLPVGGSLIRLARAQQRYHDAVERHRAYKQTRPQVPRWCTPAEAYAYENDVPLEWAEEWVSKND